MQKTILITGTSSGFGRLAVKPLLERGHRVICAMRGGETRLSEVFGSEMSLFRSRLFAVDIHMENSATFDLAAELIESKMESKLDVLINNAGYGLFGAIEDQSVEQIRHQYDVNVFGPVLLTRRLMPFLRNAKGRVINVSSIAGIVTFPLYASYCSSKYALESFSEGLYYEAKPLGVQVGLVEPGGFKTDFSKRSLNWGVSCGDPNSPYYRRTSTFKNMLQKSSGRLGNPEKVARVLVRLCEKNRIPLRTPVGADARLFYWLKQLLPEPIFVGLINFAWKKIAFRE